jgi:hypothetical protein
VPPIVATKTNAAAPTAKGKTSNGPWSPSTGTAQMPDVVIAINMTITAKPIANILEGDFVFEVEILVFLVQTSKRQTKRIELSRLHGRPKRSADSLQVLRQMLPRVLQVRL